MSSYISNQPIQYTPTQSGINLPLQAQVLTLKEGKYNTAKAQIQQTLDAYGAQDLLRDQDKEYLAGKLNYITTQINQSGNRDLSKSYVAQGIMSTVKTVAQDPIVLDAVESTQKYKNYSEGWAKIKEKDITKYSDTNYQYGLDQAGLQDYMTGKTNKLGTPVFIPYTDISKEYKEFSEHLDKYDTSVKQMYSDGKGYFVTREGSILTQQDLKNKVYTLLSDGAKQQMQVDGWATYDKGNTSEEKLHNVTTEFTNFKNAELKKIQDNIDIKKAELQNNPNDENAKVQLNNLQASYTAAKTGYDDMINKKQKSSMYTTMYMEKSLNNFASAFAFNDVHETLSVDSNYMAQKKLEYDMNKDALDREAKKKVANEEIAQKINPNPMESDYGDLYTQQTTYISNLEKQQQEQVQSVYQNLPEDVKKAIDIKVEANKGKVDKTTIIANELLNYSKTSSKLVSVEQARVIQQTSLQLTTERDTFNTYVNDAKKETLKSLDSDQMINRLVSNPNIKMMWHGVDGKERLYSAKDVLLATGVVDKEGKIKTKMSNNVGLLDALQKSIYADKIISNTNDVSRTTDWTSLRKLANIFGENPDSVATDNSDFGYPVSFNPNTKTGKFILDHKKQGGYNKAGIFSADDSFDDIPEVGTFLEDSADIQSKVNERLAQDKKLSIQKTTMISPTLNKNIFQELKRITGDVIEIKDGNSLAINIIPTQPNMVRISQLNENNKGEQSVKVADVRIEDLPQDLKNKINFQNKQAIVTTKTLPNIESKVVYGDINDNIRLIDLTQNVLYGNKDLAYQTTKQGALDALFGNQYTSNDVLGTIEKPTHVGEIVKKVIDDNNIAVKLVKQNLGNNTYVFPEIVRKNGKEETVIYQFKDPVTDANIESVYDKVTFTPHLYVNQLLQAMIVEKSQPTSTNLVFKKLEDIYGK